MFQIDFDTKCSACSLHTYKAVPGQSEVPFDKVKLMVISAYPSNLDETEGTSLTPDQKVGKDKGAGSYLRFVLQGVFDSDPRVPSDMKPFHRYCYLTNAIKCNKRESTIQDLHRRRCRDKWLLGEIAALPPNVPILLAGSDAVKLLGKYTVNNTRGQVLYYQDHPVVTTFSLIEVERGMSFLHTTDEVEIRQDMKKLLSIRKKLSNKDVDKLIKVRYWAPFPPLSMGWLFQKDINLVKDLVLGGL